MPELKKSSSISSFFNKMKSTKPRQHKDEEDTMSVSSAADKSDSASITSRTRKSSGSSIFSFGKKRKRPDSSREASVSDNDDSENGKQQQHESQGDSSYQNSQDEDEEGQSDMSSPKYSDNNEPRHANKRRRRMSEVERQAQAERDAEIAAREAELDAELDPEYRKFRPRGFKFNPPPKDRPVRVYADGVFDLFHLGHMKQLEQAKKALPNATLICGIPSDKETHRHKGLTVLSDSHRAESLRHCKWVDEVIENAPWSVTEAFLTKHKIDYVAHDDLPYASAGDDDIYKPIKEKGMFLTTQRTEGISTSDIITKIIRDYDKYLMRNFARGASRKDLNVSWLKKNELDLKRHVLEFRESFKTGFEQAKSKDLYSEIMGYISTHLTPSSHRRRLAGSSSGASTPAGGSSSSKRVGDSPRLPQSPATDFAAGYSGGSFFGNVKGWVSRKMDHFDSMSISPSPADPASPEEEEEVELGKPRGVKTRRT